MRIMNLAMRLIAKQFRQARISFAGDTIDTCTIIWDASRQWMRALESCSIIWTRRDWPRTRSWFAPRTKGSILASTDGLTNDGFSRSPFDRPCWFGGLVKRSPQKGTLWINGQAIPEGQAVPPASAPTIMATGVIVDGKQLRVGETLDLTSGERADFIPEGSVKVHRAR